MLTGKKILYITAEFPTKGTAGYHSYNRSIISSLLQLNAEVHLLVLTHRYKKLTDDLNDLPPGDLHIHAACTLRIGRKLFFFHPAAIARLLKKRLLRGLSGPTTSTGGRILIGSPSTAQHARAAAAQSRKVKPHLTLLDTIFRAHLVSAINTPAVIVAHDVFNERTASLQRSGFEPVPAVTPDFEADQVALSDGVIAISTLDASSLHNLGTNAPITVFPPPVYASSTSAHRTGSRVFYMGSGAHHNVQGLSWFFSEVWPLVRAKHSNIELLVAGEICGSIRIPCPIGATYLGRLENPEEVAKSCVASIDPVRAGSGVKVKILSYISMGLPCITTTAGSNGLDSYKEQLFVADTAHDFADALVHAIEHPLRVQSLQDDVLNARRQVDINELGRFLLNIAVVHGI